MFCCCNIYNSQFQYSFSAEYFRMNLLFTLLLSQIRNHFSLQFVRWRAKHVFIVAVWGACLCLICLSYFSSNLLLRIDANNFCLNLPFNFPTVASVLLRFITCGCPLYRAIFRAWKNLRNWSDDSFFFDCISNATDSFKWFYIRDITIGILGDTIWDDHKMDK